jgi:hypothetical protein
MLVQQLSPLAPQLLVPVVLNAQLGGGSLATPPSFASGNPPTSPPGAHASVNPAMREVAAR